MNKQWIVCCNVVCVPCSLALVLVMLITMSGLNKTRLWVGVSGATYMDECISALGEWTKNAILFYHQHYLFF